MAFHPVFHKKPVRRDEIALANARGMAYNQKRKQENVFNYCNSREKEK